MNMSRCHHCVQGIANVKKCHLIIETAAEGGNAMMKNPCNRKRIITAEEDRCVSPVAKRNRNASPSQIVADLAIAAITHNLARTIELRLN